MTQMIATEVDDKYKWEATDANGNIYVYRGKPVKDTSDDTWVLCPEDEKGVSTFVQIGRVEQPEDWEETLRPIRKIKLYDPEGDI